MVKKRKPLLKVTLILFLIYIGIRYVLPFIVVGIKHVVRSHKKPDIYYTSLVEQSDWEHELAPLADKASDIEGWSCLDKVNAGLSPAKGSDSDSDGLTDKEEIEIYGTDPLKRSSAGDLYTDGYKVANGMEPLKYYEYDGEITYKNNRTAEVTFCDTTVENLTAVARSANPGRYPVNGQQTLAVYEIAGYDGEIEINVTPLLEEGDTDISDLSVYLSDWFMIDTPKLCDHTLNDNKISVNIDQNGGNVAVLITKKGSSKLFDVSFNGRLDAYGEDREILEPDGIVLALPLSAFWGGKPKIYYVDTGDDGTNHMIKKILIEGADRLVDGKMFRHLGRDYMITEENCYPISEERLASMRKAYAILPDKCHYDPYLLDISKQNIIFNYFNYEDVSDEHLKNGYINQEFQFSMDALPFTNFGTQISPGGVCAGFSHLTALAYNTGNVPANGFYKLQRDNQYINAYGLSDTLQWDLTLAPGNEPLLSGHLSNYKYPNFSYDHETLKQAVLDPDGNQIMIDGPNDALDQYGNPLLDSAGNRIKEQIPKETYIMNNLSPGEEEFVEMMSSYWAESNDKKSQLRDELLCENNVSNYDFALIELMMEYLDKGRILDVGLTSSSVKFSEQGGVEYDPAKMSGHAINVVGYSIDENDENRILLYVYDSNLPYRNNQAYQNMYIEVNRHPGSYGHGDTFDFTYKPAYVRLKTANATSQSDDNALYLYTSDPMWTDYYIMRVSDEDFNCLNLMIEDEEQKKAVEEMAPVEHPADAETEDANEETFTIGDVINLIGDEYSVNHLYERIQKVKEIFKIFKP